MKPTLITLVASTLLLLVAPLASAADGEFPGRPLFPGVPYMSTEELNAQLKDVVVVDVRSKYEFDTLQISGARNIPLSDNNNFLNDMSALRAASGDKPIVVYCNGKTCLKSYEAAKYCNDNHISGVVAYDSGIMDWAKAHPNKAQLLGRTLGDPKRLISSGQFDKHLLTPEAFGDQVGNSDDYVLDVRDRYQREGLSLFVGRERRVYLDDTKRIDQFIQRARDENKMLLIYDAAGAQVRWLQYYLEDKGFKNYRFMKGGMSAYYKELRQDFAGGSDKKP